LSLEVADDTEKSIQGRSSKRKMHGISWGKRGKRTIVASTPLEERNASRKGQRKPNPSPRKEKIRLA